MARQQRDGSIKRVVIESLQAQLAHVTSHADALRRTAQAVANAACLIVAAPYIDDFTVKSTRWATEHKPWLCPQMPNHVALYTAAFLAIGPKRPVLTSGAIRKPWRRTRSLEEPTLLSRTSAQHGFRRRG